MSIRIAYTLCYAHVRFGGSRHLAEALPHSRAMLVLFATAAFTTFTSWTQGLAVHFGAGVASLLILLGATFHFERDTLRNLGQLKSQKAE